MRNEDVIRSVRILRARVDLFLAGEGDLTRGELELAEDINSFMEERHR